MAENEQTDEILDKDHPYGKNHELVGKPCMYDGRPAVPYGSYDVGDVRLLVVAILNEVGEGDNIATRASGMSGVNPKELEVLDPDSIEGKKVYHTVLDQLALQSTKHFNDERDKHFREQDKKE